MAITAWATAADLQDALKLYTGATDGILSDMTDDESEAMLDKALLEATKLLQAYVPGRIVVTDASLCGLDAICVQLACGMLLQGIYGSRNPMYEEDGKRYEARAMQALSSIMGQEIADLLAMDGIESRVVEAAADAPKATIFGGSTLKRRVFGA